MNRPEFRPWGNYTVLADIPETKVKLIEVEPHQRLSYQFHHRRREQWTVTYGELTVVLDGEEHTVNVGESIHIPLGAKHRAWNKTDKLVRFVEVQTGDYFGEDDIVRVEDDYDRS